MTRLVLMNAVYFDAMWKDTFEREDTRSQQFCLVTGDSAAISMMHQTARMKCAENASWQALEMPYDGNEMSMVILLPRTNAGLASLENALTAGMIDTIISGMADTPVVLSLPKFEFTSGSISLVGPMEALGMHDAFSSIANFSGIDGQQDLSITDIIQKAFVAVDEKGTTAAAATAVTIGVTSIQIPDNPIYFTADHPFLFFIRDIATGQIVFIGKVMKP
jgi:serpin B